MDTWASVYKVLDGILAQSAQEEVAFIMSSGTEALGIS